MIETLFALYILDIIALLFLFGLIYRNNLLHTKRKISFSFGIVLTILIIISEFGTILASADYANLRTLNIFFNVLGFTLTPILPLVLINIFDNQVLKKHKLLLLPTVLNIFISIFSPIFGFIFQIDLANHYMRGPLFFLFAFVYIFNIVMLLIVTGYNSQKHYFPIRWALISLSIFAIAGTSIQLAYPFIYSSWHCITLTLFLLYIILSDFEGSFDSLTKLYNRASFEKASSRLPGKKVFSVVVLDINNFKEINDTYGHDYGDTVLEEVASLLREAFDQSCTIYRIGGDEFAIIRKDANEENLKVQLKQMTTELTKKRLDNRHIPTISYGYSVSVGRQCRTFQNLLKEADKQMYYHKQLQQKNATPFEK